MSSKKTQPGQRNALLMGASVFAAAAAAFSGAPAMAQEAAEEEAIIVTGSRVARRDLIANSPITTVGEEEIGLSGVLSVESLLNELPQVVPGLNGTSNNPGLNGQATVDLRGLGSARTLVLVDGRRLSPSDKNGIVDLNLIPATLIQNIEVVTGGASAVYGSDAVSGVVNFILKDDFEGVEIGVLRGISDQGDAQEYAFDLTMGGGFGEGRGHATIYTSYYDRDSLLGAERAASQNCHPFFCSSRIPNGVLVNSVLNPFPAGGSLRIDDAGNEYNPAEGPYNFSPVNLLTLPAERWTFGMFGTYEFTPSVEGYFSSMISDSSTAVQLAPSPLASTNNVSIGAAVALSYLPGPNVTAQINGRTNPNGRIVLQRRMLEWGPRMQEFDKNFFQTTIGLRGDIADDWRWDVYFQTAQTDMYDTLSNDASESRLQQGLDLCPVGSDPGCLAFDPFGEGSATPAFVEWSQLDNVTDHHRYEQEVFSASITGDLFELPAGPLGVAFGVEYRQDSLLFEPSPVSLGDLVGFNGVTPSGGSDTVNEVFGEAIIPLLKDAPLANYVGLEVGYRSSDYTSAGKVETYKIGGEWQLTDSFRLRGMFNAATRAPSVFQLFRAGDQNFPGYVDPCRNSVGVGGGQAALNGTAVAIGSPGWNFCAGWLGLSTALVDQAATDAVLDSFWQSDSQVETLLYGNQNLTPEDSETITYGAVFNHNFGFGDISATVDYYDITVANSMGNPTANAVLGRCTATLNLVSPQCVASPRLSSGQLGGIVQSLENLPGETVTKGIDVQVGYSADLMGGTLDVNALMTFLDEFSISGTEYAGAAYGLGVVFPEFKSTARVSYRYNDWQFSWQWEHISELDDYFYSSTYAGTPYAANYPFIDAIDYHDFTVRWFANDQLELTVTCENCLDQEPQAGTIQGSAAGLGVDTSLYDIIGRYYRIGLRARF